MKEKAKKGYATVEEYLAQFSPDRREILQKIRETIKDVMPDAQEVISYQIPAFKLKRVVIYFAGWADHVSVYPIPRGDESFQKDIKKYVAGRGTLKFTLDQPIPYELIKRTAEFSKKEFDKA